VAISLKRKYTTASHEFIVVRFDRIKIVHTSFDVSKAGKQIIKNNLVVKMIEKKTVKKTVKKQ